MFTSLLLFSPAAQRIEFICIYIYISILVHRQLGAQKTVRPQFQVTGSLTTDGTGAFNSGLTDGTGIPYPLNGIVNTTDDVPLSAVQGFKQVALPWYADQCLPFDITIAAANEYGAAASARLFGVEILNEGFGTSVDDSVLEQQGTFIARSVLPLQAVGRTNLIAA